MEDPKIRQGLSFNDYLLHHGTILISILSLEQEQLVLRSPQLLTSLLAMTLSHNWLVPTLHVMHLHAYIAQALIPGSDELLQLPHVSPSVLSSVGGPSRAEGLVENLREKEPASAADINKAGQHVGRLEIADAYFKGL